MKRQIKVITALTIAIVAGIIAFVACSDRQTGHVNAPKIIDAAKTYTADLRAKGVTIPPTVSLQELISRGLLTKSDVSGFAGTDVTISLSADSNRPQEVLIRARLAGGQEMAVLADGSIQQVSTNRPK